MKADFRSCSCLKGTDDCLEYLLCVNQCRYKAELPELVAKAAFMARSKQIAVPMCVCGCRKPAEELRHPREASSRPGLSPLFLDLPSTLGPCRAGMILGGRTMRCQILASMYRLLSLLCSACRAFSPEPSRAILDSSQSTEDLFESPVCDQGSYLKFKSKELVQLRLETQAAFTEHWKMCTEAVFCVNLQKRGVMLEAVVCYQETTFLKYIFLNHVSEIHFSKPHFSRPKCF